MTPTAITLNQTRLMLDPRGALYWPDRDLLAVAETEDVAEKLDEFHHVPVATAPHGVGVQAQLVCECGC